MPIIIIMLVLELSKCLRYNPWFLYLLVFLEQLEMVLTFNKILPAYLENDTNMYPMWVTAISILTLTVLPVNTFLVSSLLTPLITVLTFYFCVRAKYTLDPVYSPLTGVLLSEQE